MIYQMNFYTAKTDEVDLVLREMRALVKRAEPRREFVPVERVANNDPDKIEFREGEWTRSPWSGMRSMLTHSDHGTGAKYVLCEVQTAIDLGVHRHPVHAEEVTMMEGAMEDVIMGKTIYPGIRYKIGPGVAHWPVFSAPALFMVVFRPAGRE
jgi:quercetin dioxygenase-like cupin family protein